ncbi:MAG: hypothetical protein DBY09_07485 [Selenomonadales bacterium]|nr:MAG: hypothetical protein DBY09_07485 [Selenomonadales bacterium]
MLVLFIFQQKNAWFIFPPTVINTKSVEFAFKLFVPDNLSGAQSLLAKIVQATPLPIPILHQPKWKV